jgi:predicted DNA-binding protein (MmcQ/YjbR family)
MTKKGIIDYCLSLEGAYKDYPFGDTPLIVKISVKNKQKFFCAIYEETKPLHILLKCDPEEAYILRQLFKSIKLGYHCNKDHWNSVYIDGSIADNETKRMIHNSFLLVSNRKKEIRRF